MLKKFILFSFLFLFLFAPINILVSKALAAPTPEAKPLEIKYPPLPMTPAPTSTTAAPEYFKYVFYFLLITSGLIALGSLIAAGFQWLSSSGSPDKIANARDRIMGAISGLLILFLSVLIIRTINPQFLDFDKIQAPFIPSSLSAGVYFCKTRVDILNFETYRKEASIKKNISEQLNYKKILDDKKKEISDNCYLAPNKGDFPLEFEDNIKFVYLVPLVKEIEYGAILFEERDFSGEARIMYDSQNDAPTEWPIPDGFKASSEKILIINHEPKSTWYAIFFPKYDFGTTNSISSAQISWPYISETQISASDPIYPEFPPVCSFNLPQKIESLKIEGDLIVIFFPENTGDWTLKTKIDLFTSSDSNFYDNTVGIGNKDGNWRPDCYETTYKGISFYPCAGRAVVLSAKTF